MPLFLRAASLEANRDWKALHGVAQEWVAADDNNPASWLCLGRILTRLEHDQAAAHAFAHAAALAPSLERKSDLRSAPANQAQVAYRSVRLDRPTRQ